MLRSARLVKISCVFSKKFAKDVVLKLQDMGFVHLIKAEGAGFKAVTATNSEYDGASKLLSRTDYLIDSVESKTLPLIRKIFGPRYISVKETDYENIKNIGKKLQELETKYRGSKNKAKVNISDYNQLFLFRDILNDVMKRFQALECFSESKHNMLFEGWVGHDKAQRVKNAVELTTKNTCVFEAHLPKKDEEPPSLLENPPIIKPFEIFTENYGLPSYREMDPTPIIAFTFILMFGLMFSDVGYGLGLTVLSLFIYFYTTKESKLRKSINLILIYSGLSSMFFGLLFGEFFGLHFRKGVIDPLSDIILFLLISVLIGLVHMSIGIISKIITNINKSKVWLHSISLLLIMWSTFSLYYVRDISLNKILLFTGVVILLVIKKLDAIKGLLALVTGAISYVRIAILGVAHIVVNRMLISSYHNLSGNILEVALFVVLFGIGSFIVLILGVFISYIQTLRLHWIEFFSQFYEGKGYEFKPFNHNITL